MVTGTGSENDLGALGVDANTVTARQLADLIETSKYTRQPRMKTIPVDFDEVFLTRATNVGFLTKLGQAVGMVRSDGWLEVIVYANGPRSVAEASAGGWAGIARAGAVVGLEAYSTTFWGGVKAALDQYSFVDAADLATCIANNPALYAAFQDLLRGYVRSAKTQLADPALYTQLTLLEYEHASHDIAAAKALGYSTEKATHFAALWYAALEAIAASESIHFGIWHPS